MNGLREGTATFVDRMTGEEIVFQSTLIAVKSGFGGVDPQTGLPFYVSIKEADGSGLRVNSDRTYTLTKSDGTTLQFDTKGNLVQIVDSDAHALDYHYLNGKLSDITDFLDRKIQLTYDVAGRIARADGPLGYGIVYGYDPNGNLASVFNEHTQQTLRYSYDSDHRIIDIKDPSGRAVLQAQLDVMGRISTQKDDRGNTFYVTRTADNQKTITNDPVTGKQITEEYDSLHRLVKRTDYLGQSTTYQYLASEQKPFAVSDPKGFTTYYFYDQNHNLTDIFDLESNVHQIFEYDERNNLIAQTDRNGIKTTFVYDTKNNVKEIRRPVDQFKTAVVYLNYDVNGKLISYIDPMGHERLITRDAFGNIKTMTSPGGGSEAQTLDSFFRLSSSKDAENRTRQYRYDSSLDLPTAIQDAFGTTILTYDSLGRTTSITDPKGNLSKFLYDPATGDLLSTIQQLVGETLTTDVISKYTYDRSGNLTSVTDPNNVTTTFQYDELNRLTRVGKQQLQGAAFRAAYAAAEGTRAIVLAVASKALDRMILRYRRQGETEFVTIQTADLLTNQYSFSLENLEPNTIYEYKIEGMDLFGNQATYPVQTFETGDRSLATPVILLNRVESTDLNSATFSVSLASGSFVGNINLQVTPVQGGDAIQVNRAIMPDANNLITVSGLTPNTEYVYTLFVQNLSGQTFFPVTTHPIRFWTKNKNDTTGPVVIINDPESITSHEFLLNLAANEALAKVEITVTPSTGGTSKVITFYAPQEGAQLKVTGLLADTEYTYALTVTDFSGNTTASSSQSLHTPVFESDPAELIYHAPVEIKTEEARIRIKTNERLSRVIISLIPLDTMIPQEITFGGSLSLDREFTLKGLRPGLDYYYQITIIDEAGNTTYSAEAGQFHTRVF